MKSVALLGLLLCAGCANGPPTTCDVHALVEADVDGVVTVLDCSPLHLDAGASNPMQTAQQCVLDAIRKQVAFVLVFDDPRAPPGMHYQSGLSGVLFAKHMVVRSYVYTGDAHPQVSVRTCSEKLASDGSFAPAMSAAAGCKPAPGVACLSCNNPSGGALLCGG